MKKTILLSSLFAAAAAVAGEVVSSNAVAALNKEIGNSAAQTLLAVPFEGYEEAGKVKVADIVKTSDLAKDSKLYVPNADGGYDTWKLNENGQWEPGVKVSVGSGEPVESATPSADALTINRGDAFWLEPVFASGNTGTVFLLGQGDGTSGKSMVAPGVWNLVGNASAGDQTEFSVKATKADKVVVQRENGSLRYYTYSDTKKAWRYQDDTTGKYVEETPTIKAGQGLWYYSKDTASKDIQW